MYNLILFYLKKTVVITAVLIGFLGNAQNLIGNGGFESYTQLPVSYGQLARATGWVNPMGATAGTPDYFQTTSGTTFNLSDKIAPQSGAGYAGTFLEMNTSSAGAQYREYMTRQLASTLVGGAVYKISFYVAHLYGAAPAMFNQPAGLTFYDLPAAEQGYLGAVFSTAQPVLSNTVGNTSPRWTSIRDDFGVGRVTIPNTNTSVYGATSRYNWVPVTLSYVATGTEQYVTFGQLRPGVTSLTDLQAAYYIYDGFYMTVPTVLTKSVSPASITDGGTAKYTFTLTNTSTGNLAQSGLSFTDTLPSGLIVAATPNVVVSGLTGGTVTATGGSNSITVTGYSQVAGGTATITVDVTNVSGQLNASCGSNPATFTNSANNISNISQNITNAVGNVCIIVNAAPCLAGTEPPVISSFQN